MTHPNTQLGLPGVPLAQPLVLLVTLFLAVLSLVLVARCTGVLGPVQLSTSNLVLMSSSPAVAVSS